MLRRFGVEVQDFGESWRSGLAFLALIQSLSPARVDLVAALSREPRDNLRLAFSTARRCLGVAPLLEPDGTNAAAVARVSGRF